MFIKQFLFFIAFNLALIPFRNIFYIILLAIYYYSINMLIILKIYSNYYLLNLDLSIFMIFLLPIHLYYLLLLFYAFPNLLLIWIFIHLVRQRSNIYSFKLIDVILNLNFVIVENVKSISLGNKRMQ